jgi:hypothetical protein
MALRRPQSEQKRIPKFKSLDEEAEFWEKHSPLEFEDEWVEVKQVKVDRPLSHVLAVRLDAKTLDRLAKLGHKKGMGPSTLARMWLLERLDQETYPSSSDPR